MTSLLGLWKIAEGAVQVGGLARQLMTVDTFGKCVLAMDAAGLSRQLSNEDEERATHSLLWKVTGLPSDCTDCTMTIGLSESSDCLTQSMPTIT